MASNKRKALVDSPCWQVLAVLVHDQASRAALAVCIERDLDVDDLHEIVSIALWKQLSYRIASRLSEKVLAFPRHGHDDIRCQFVSANISIEHLGIDRHFFMLLERRSRRQPVIGCEALPFDRCERILQQALQDVLVFGPSRPPGSSRRAGGYSPVFRLGSLTRLPGREPCPKKQILLDM